MAELMLHRRASLWQDRVRDYHLLLDGREAGRVANGATLRLELSPGHHTLQMAIDWCRSPPLEISLAEGESARLECGANAHPLLALLYISLWKDRYLWLRRASDR